MANLGQFLREVRVEMAKVVWPTRTQLIVYTLVVVAMSLGVAVFLGALDFGFQNLLTNYILK